ncbi:hypothetical protein K431DRAFT_57090 [Polychaeton citri CBS 116435]|uniref:Uncharacterized protein n=1 Tax=Polychaeton citri CBS 116435 TaxID=1314669 RepID=A0A9P4QBZ4_9PEZI|nr:hypothetical protein K431DRAFT_57090 [Polychaeton citri CBS 116435]
MPDEPEDQLPERRRYGQKAERPAVVAQRNPEEHPPQYKKYEKCRWRLFLWKDSDLENMGEVNDLQTELSNRYSDDVEIVILPSKDTLAFLKREVLKFIIESKGKNHQLVIYYGGHAHTNTNRDRLWWHPRADSTLPQCCWTDLYNDHLKELNEDILEVLDCCFAASVLPPKSRTAKEVMAASDRHKTAPSGCSPNSPSFTMVFTEILQELTKPTLASTVLKMIEKRMNGFKPVWGPLQVAAHQIALDPTMVGRPKGKEKGKATESDHNHIRRAQTLPISLNKRRT